MPDITSGIVLLALGGWSLFVSYQVIRHGRFYWMYPTISGFKRRKEDTISKWFAVPIGTISLLFTFFVLWLGYHYLSEIF